MAKVPEQHWNSQQRELSGTLTRFPFNPPQRNRCSGKNMEFIVRMEILCINSAAFELKSTEVNITAEGGQASMPYTLENPIDSLKVVAESEAGWLGRFEDNGSEIMFFVDPNEEASSRSAEVTAVYGDIVQTFTVNQDGAVGPFQFNVKEIGYDHITYDVIPEDKEMTYISYVSTLIMPAGTLMTLTRTFRTS